MASAGVAAHQLAGSCPSRLRRCPKQPGQPQRSTRRPPLRPAHPQGLVAARSLRHAHDKGLGSGSVQNASSLLCRCHSRSVQALRSGSDISTCGVERVQRPGDHWEGGKAQRGCGGRQRAAAGGRLRSPRRLVGRCVCCGRRLARAPYQLPCSPVNAFCSTRSSLDQVTRPHCSAHYHV